MKLKRIITIMICMVLLFSGIPTAPKIHAESITENRLSAVTTLEKDKTYYYDLNGDGTPDKIMYQFTENDDGYSVSFDLYINDKLCISKKTDGFSCMIQICDLDTSDTYLDLYVTTRGDSDGIIYSSFARYDGETVREVTGFTENAPKGFIFYRYGLNKINGDGTFTLSVDTPISSNAIGCYNCDIPYQLKDNKLSSVPTHTYEFSKELKKYKYKAQKNFSVYKKADSKKVLFQIRKGDKVTFDQFYVTKSGKVYLKLKNSQGKTGWISSASQNLFSNCKYWG